jgi:hypothetical protein
VEGQGLQAEADGTERDKSHLPWDLQLTTRDHTGHGDLDGLRAGSTETLVHLTGLGPLVKQPRWLGAASLKDHIWLPLLLCIPFRTTGLKR